MRYRRLSIGVGAGALALGILTGALVGSSEDTSSPGPPAKAPASQAEGSQAQAPAPYPADSANRRGVPTAVNTVDDLILLEKSARSLPPVKASPDEPSVARLVSRVLPQSHYTRMPLDDEVSDRFLNEYLDALDGLHLHFLESDVQEFSKYRHRLDDLTLEGDTAPAREIFARFLERLEQRVEYVAELLRSERFEFNGDDSYVLDRRKSPRPKDLDEAKQLWRQHLRSEVLQKRLEEGADKAKKKTGSAGAAATAAATNAAPAVVLANGLTEETTKALLRRYAQLLRTVRDLDGADVFQVYLTALTHVYDPHSDYLGRASLENFAINMNLALFGIGAVLQSEDGYCKVRELRPGPAMRSKQIKPGDRIVAVAQGDGEPVDVVDMKLTRVVELVRGPKGTKVRLTLIPVDATDASERREVTLVRDEIKLEDEEARARIIDVPGPEGRVRRLGVIDLPSFYSTVDMGPRNGRVRPKSTTIDVARLLEKLKAEKVEGVILDLRRNGGGSLEEAIELTGLFIPQGPVVQVKSANGRVNRDSDSDPMVLYEGPLVVLTSRFSASASEIVAGALQDYGRGLIVGDSSTHGKGTVQSLMQLDPLLARDAEDSTNSPGALKLTIRKFYRPSGSSTQLKGVIPDIVLPSVNNVADLGEASLENPLPWDTISRARFTPVDEISPLLGQLKQQSRARVAEDRDFGYVLEDIEFYQKHLAEKQVSLNEEIRRKEKKEHEDRIEARKQERASRQDPPETVYRIGLKQTTIPGLPAPVATGDKAKADAGAEDEGSAGVAASSDGEGDASGEDAEDPALDVSLKEAKRILIDLIDLEKSAGTLTVRQ